MRTRVQCLEKAAYCERLARECNVPSSAELLLEAARHWRSLAELSSPQVLPAKDSSVPTSAIDDATLEKMLSEVGSPIR